MDTVRPTSASAEGIAAVERMTTSEVLVLARISRATLWRRISAGRFPSPIDKGKQALFLKSSVLSALRADQPYPVAVSIEDRLEAMRSRRKKTP